MAALYERLGDDPRAARAVLAEAATLTGEAERLADLIARELATSFPDAPEATCRIASGAATSLLRTEIASSGPHGLADLAGDLTFAAIGPIVGPELALAQANGSTNRSSMTANGGARNASGQTNASTTGPKAPSRTTTTKEGSA